MTPGTRVVLRMDSSADGNSINSIKCTQMPIHKRGIARVAAHTDLRDDALCIIKRHHAWQMRSGVVGVRDQPVCLLRKEVRNLSDNHKWPRHLPSPSHTASDCCVQEYKCLAAPGYKCSSLATGHGVRHYRCHTDTDVLLHL